MNRQKSLLSLFALPAILNFFGATAMAQDAISYKTETADYEGYLFEPLNEGAYSGVSVLIAHDFLGPGDNQFAMAEQFASDGALVFVADFYGTAIRPQSVEDATAQALRVRGDVTELRSAMSAALTELEKAGGTPQKTAVIGTSVGGLAALELGRTGAKLGAIVVLWGVFENTAADSASDISAKVTFLQGDLDPLASAEARIQIKQDLESSGTDYDITVFEGVAHAFTLPFMGTDTSTGFAYDEAATAKSMQKIDDVLKGL